MCHRKLATSKSVTSKSYLRKICKILEFRDFYPRASGLFRNFLPTGWDFFRRMGYLDKKPTLISRKSHLENLVTRRT